MFTVGQTSAAYHHMLEHDHIEQDNQQKIVKDLFDTLEKEVNKERKRLFEAFTPNTAIERHVKECILYKAAEFALTKPFIRNDLLDFTAEVKINEEGQLIVDYVMGDSLRALFMGYSEKKTLNLTSEQIEQLWVSKYGNKLP